MNNQREYDLDKLEEMKAKIDELESQIKTLTSNSTYKEKYNVKVVSLEDEIIALAKQGYNSQLIGSEIGLTKKYTG